MSHASLCSLLCCIPLLAVHGCDPETAATTTDAGTPWQGQFPEDFADHFQEMRDCRHSHEHELRYIRVFASPQAQPSYAALSPDAPYPPSALLVKIEYDDEDCTLPLEYTAVQKLDPGENPPGGDWRWQRVSLEGKVLEDGAPTRCIRCHTVHCAPPYGYDLTCAEEL